MKRNVNSQVTGISVIKLRKAGQNAIKLEIRFLLCVQSFELCVLDKHDRTFYLLCVHTGKSANQSSSNCKKKINYGIFD